MAVYRVNKNRGYTVMANYHLRDKTLSLKAVGLLSKMLSFNDGWQFSTKGLSAICKEGPDAVLAALRELEDHGYLIRHRQRDAKGRMSNTVFEIYEQPQPVSPHRENPDVDNPDMENPHLENPHGENPAQLNTNQVITNERNNSLNNYQSINLDGMDRMDEREQYRELIRDNLEIDIRSQDRHYDLDRVNDKPHHPYQRRGYAAAGGQVALPQAGQRPHRLCAPSDERLPFRHSEHPGISAHSVV